MNDPYTKLYDKPFDSHYMLEEIDIDRPVENVWPFALSIGDWMNAHDLKTLDGQPGEVGHFERVFPKFDKTKAFSKLSRETPEPRSHVYGIAHLIPNKYIALEVMSEKGGSYGEPHEWVSFDGILLNDLGGRTRITFLFIEMQMGKAGTDEYVQRSAFVEEVAQMVRGYLRQLKRQVEA